MAHARMWRAGAMTSAAPVRATKIVDKVRTSQLFSATTFQPRSPWPASGRVAAKTRVHVCVWDSGVLYFVCVRLRLVMMRAPRAHRRPTRRWRKTKRRCRWVLCRSLGAFGVSHLGSCCSSAGEDLIALCLCLSDPAPRRKSQRRRRIRVRLTFQSLLHILLSG